MDERQPTRGAEPDESSPASPTSRYTSTVSTEANRLHEAATWLRDEDRRQLAVALSADSDGWATEMRRNTEREASNTELLWLYDTAMRLSEGERTRFVALLVEGIGKQPTQEIDAWWVAEAKRRLEDIRAGRMQTFSLEEVMGHARAALERAKQARRR